MRVVMHLSLPADGRMLPHTRHAVAGYLTELNLDREQCHDVVLAIDEACANVIRHAFVGSEPPEEGGIELTAELEEHEVRVTVEDRGVGLDPAHLRNDEPVPATAASGRGLQIIRELMTTVELDSTAEGGTRLSMSKRLSA